MLHLAQVQKQGLLGQINLRLLAQKLSDRAWTILAPEDTLICAGVDRSSAENDAAFIPANHWGEGALVLVEISDTQEIISIQDATDWVLGIVEQYLSPGATSDYLQKEVELIEQWRQSLTLQSQELSRRTLELEARRDQIQALEEKLQREKHLLEVMVAKLKTYPNQPS